MTSCSKCHNPKIKECDGPAENQVTKCSTGYHLDTTCKPCGAGVKYCLKENINKPIKDERDTEYCIFGYVKSSDGNSCKKCPGNEFVRTCTEDLSYLLCFNGYYYKNNDCIKCPGNSRC